MGQIDVQNLTKEYTVGVRAVDDVSLTIGEGEFVVLVGPSGCGKTTLLRCIGGLETVTAGRILIGERDVTKLQPSARDLAMVFQNYALYPHMTVRKNLGYGLRVRKTPKKEIVRRVAEAAKLLELEELLDRRPGQLSGGQQQRVAMGRALVREPAAFLMDEPLSNLDALLRVATRGEILKLQRRLGTTTVYVTHDQVEAMTMSDRIAMMDAGRILQLGTPAELYQRPSNVKVAAFIGSPAINLLPARVRDRNTIELFGQPLLFATGLLPGSPVTIGLRPEAIGFGAGPATEAGFTAEARLQRKENLGPEFILHLEVAGPEPASVIARIAAGPKLPPLQGGVTLRFASDACHVFDEQGERLEPQPGRDKGGDVRPRSTLTDERVPA